MDSWYARVKDLGDVVSGETREAVLKSLKRENFRTAPALPVKFTLSLGKALFHCGSDLLRIYSSTARETLALFAPSNSSERKTFGLLPETSSRKRL